MIIAEAEKVASDLGAYLQQVEHGETVLITVQNRPVAELRPAALSMAVPRPFGLCAGEFVVPGDFDSALPEDVIADFEN